jgi:hypothetical protein
LNLKLWCCGSHAPSGIILFSKCFFFAKCNSDKPSPALYKYGCSELLPSHEASMYTTVGSFWQSFGVHIHFSLYHIHFGPRILINLLVIIRP